MPGFHHVAYACRDIKETVRFYEALGFPLVYTEVKGQPGPDGVMHYMRHIFFDLGDGSALAFFDLHNVGEAPEWKTDLGDATGTPTWVNHFAFKADFARQEEVRAKMDAADIKPYMDLDHDWCHSLYYLDPNGIMLEFCRDTPGFKADPAEAHRLLDVIPG